MNKNLAVLALAGLTLAGCQSTQAGTVFKNGVVSSSQPTTTAYVAMDTNTKNIVPNALRNIKVVDNWQPVKNYKLAVSEEAFQYTHDDDVMRGFVEKDFGADKCQDMLKKASYKGRSKYNGSNMDLWYTRCSAYAIGQGKQGNKQYMADILLAWADNNVSLKGTGGPGNWTTLGYQIPSTMGTFAQYYGFHYQSFPFTDEQRSRVDAHLKAQMMRHRFGNIGSGPRHNKNCYVDVPEKKMIQAYTHHKTLHNDCGSIRYKVSVGEIVLGFALGDQELLNKGHDDIYVVFAQFTSNGVGFTHAAKGAYTVNYSLEYAAYMSILTELYKSVGYDFLEHTLPHGAKVWETLVNAYKLKEDHTYYAEYADPKPAQKHTPGLPRYSKIAKLTRAQWLATDYANNVYDYAGGDKQFIKRHMEFVDRYMPEIDVSDNDIMLYLSNKNHHGANYGLFADIMHIANK